MVTFIYFRYFVIFATFHDILLIYIKATLLMIPDSLPQLQPRCMRVSDVQQILRPDGEPSQPFCYTRSPLIRRPLRTENILFRIQIVNSSPFLGQSLHTNDIVLTGTSLFQQNLGQLVPNLSNSTSNPVARVSSGSYNDDRRHLLFPLFNFSP